MDAPAPPTEFPPLPTTNGVISLCYESKCGQLALDADGNVIITSSENDGRAVMTEDHFLQIMADPHTNPFDFLTGAEWAEVCRLGAHGLDQAKRELVTAASAAV